MKGARVRIHASWLPKGWSDLGVVIAENELMLGVRLDDGSVPVIIPKKFVRAMLT